MKKNKIEHYSDKEALEFHLNNKSGKIEIISSKPMTTKRDLALAYSPGVAAPVKAIAENPELAYEYTTKGNLVAVISNGSAILGLGNLGAIASKPVMEGKAVLFKRFADIDSIDLEIDTEDTKEIINTIKHIAKSFGGINLEDIEAPNCFIIEEELKLLKELQPVMGLPDSLKAKNLFENRKELIKKAFREFDAKNNDKCFNFDEVLNNSEKDVGKNWKSITEKDPEANKIFPIIETANIDKFRFAIKEDLSTYMKDNYPSLKKDL